MKNSEAIRIAQHTMITSYPVDTKEQRDTLIAVIIALEEAKEDALEIEIMEESKNAEL